MLPKSVWKSIYHTSLFPWKSEGMHTVYTIHAVEKGWNHSSIFLVVGWHVRKRVELLAGHHHGRRFFARIKLKKRRRRRRSISRRSNFFSGLCTPDLSGITHCALKNIQAWDVPSFDILKKDPGRRSVGVSFFYSIIIIWWGRFARCTSSSSDISSPAQPSPLLKSFML